MVGNMTLGGYRIKKKLKNGQSLLLDAIWVKHGGVVAVAKKLGVSVQTPANWRKRGFVPPKDVHRVAKILGELPWAFHYKHLSALLEGDKTPWVDVVKSCALAKDVERKVLGGTEPL